MNKCKIHGRSQEILGNSSIMSFGNTTFPNFYVNKRLETFKKVKAHSRFVESEHIVAYNDN